MARIHVFRTCFGMSCFSHYASADGVAENGALLEEIDRVLSAYEFYSEMGSKLLSMMVMEVRVCDG